MSNNPEPKLKFDPVQVRVKGLAVSRFIVRDFLNAMSKEFPNAKYITIRFVVPEARDAKDSEKTPEKEKLELVTLGHYAKEHAEEGILTVDCDSPETLKRVEKVLQEFNET